MSASHLSSNCRVVGEELSRAASDRCGDGQLSSLTCAFLARLFLLQAKAAKEKAEGEEGGDEEEEGEASVSLLPHPVPPFLRSLDRAALDWDGRRLSSSEVDVWVDSLLPALLSLDHPLQRTLRLQVDFELRHALQSHLGRMTEAEERRETEKKVEAVMAVRIGEGEEEQRTGVPAFYAVLFALTLHSNGGGGLAAPATEGRKMEREVAAALESVFPLPHLLAWAELREEERRAELDGLPALVRGIRLFNRQLRKGGEGLTCQADDVERSNAELQSDIDKEAAFIGEIAQAYTDVVHMWEDGRRSTGRRSAGKGGEEEKEMASFLPSASSPPSPPSSFVSLRVRCELIHRRQFLLFLQSLQADCAEASLSIRSAASALESLYSQLTAIVGLRSSVPKHAVFPLFQQVGALYQRLLDEERRVGLRRELFAQLKDSRNPFITALQAETIGRAKEARRRSAPQKEAEQFHFVRTLADGEEADAEASSCVRVARDSCAAFMTLPLALQGYCAFTLVEANGFLVAGDPALGLLRYEGHFFAFASLQGMRAFHSDPAGLLRALEVDVVPVFPSLVHLLGLQPRFPHTDVAQYITASLVQQVFHHQQAQQQRTRASPSSSPSPLLPPVPPSTRVSSTQTPTHLPVADAAEDGGSTASSLSSLHWNEWEMRRRALQMADLTRSRTHSTQTELSHYRRDNSSQYTLAARQDDGVAAGRGTQTRVDVATNSERRHVVLTGLRKASEHGATQLTPITLSLPSIVQQPTNPDLRG